MKLLIFYSLFFLCALTLKAQSGIEWQGDWDGILTQEKGGFKSTYQVKLNLKKNGEQIEGYFYVLEKGLTSKMSISGTWLSNNRIKILDEKIIEHNEPDNIEWCFKTYILDFKEIKGVKTLQGKWTGKSKSADCIPGKVKLRRPVPRA